MTLTLPRTKETNKTLAKLVSPILGPLYCDRPFELSNRSADLNSRIASDLHPVSSVSVWSDFEIVSIIFCN